MKSVTVIPSRSAHGAPVSKSAAGSLTETVTAAPESARHFSAAAQSQASEALRSAIGSDTVIQSLAGAEPARVACRATLPLADPTSQHRQHSTLLTRWGEPL